MITTKDELKYYMQCDKNALGIRRKHPRLFADEVWKFQRSLRRLEYFSNRGGYYCRLMKFFERIRFHKLSIKLGLSIPINVFGPGLVIVHYGTIVVSSGSNIGKNCRIHEGVTIGATNGSLKAAEIGDNVMMGPNVFILDRNHSFDRVDIPMIQQGFTPKKQTSIGNDVWIGRDVLMTPGRTIMDGTIVAGGCVLCKDFPAYSIVGGNPSRLIKRRC